MDLLEKARQAGKGKDQVADASFEPQMEPISVTAAKKSKGSEYQKRKREERVKAAETIQAVIQKAGLKLTEEEQAAMDVLLAKPKEGAARIGGKPIIYKMFGDAPKKGDTVNATDMFLRTGKGYAEIKSHIKKWAEKGITVVFDEKAKAFKLDSDIPAYTEE